MKLVAVLKDGFEGVSGEEILSWSRTQVAAYKAPRKVQFTGALPRTEAEKEDLKS